jgi:precorrin-2 dehydrogenase / sirohydrochlorin ferrochelatase
MKGLNKVFLPVSIDITDTSILILGGGQSAYKKIKILQKFTSNFHVVAREVCNDIKNEGISYVEKDIEREDLKGHKILYSCTNNRELNKNIVEWGHNLCMWVNIHDDPELCDFVSPAIYKQDNITISVATNGEDALLAIAIRDRIKKIVESENLHEWQL